MRLALQRALQRALRLAPVALIAAGLLTGCATIRGSRRIDVGPFAENTMGMVGELQKFNRPAVWTRLKKYQSLPSVLQAQQDIGRMRILMRGVALYSSQVASLYDAPISEERKITELARYLDEIVRPNLALLPARSELSVTPGYMDSLVQNIRSREKLLDALGAAQPLVSMTVSAGDAILDQVDVDVQTAAADLNARVEAEYAPLKARITELEDMHLASIRSYTLLQRHRAGDPAALDSLRVNDPGLRDLLPAGRAATAKELEAAERFVIDRISTLKSLRDQLEPDFSIYRESQAELEGLRVQAEDRARLARVTLVMWSRSHRNLAAGVPVPPVIDVMGAMRSTISTGVKGVLP